MLISALYGHLLLPQSQLISSLWPFVIICKKQSRWPGLLTARQPRCNNVKANYLKNVGHQSYPWILFSLRQRYNPTVQKTRSYSSCFFVQKTNNSVHQCQIFDWVELVSKALPFPYRKVIRCNSCQPQDWFTLVGLLDDWTCFHVRFCDVSMCWPALTMFWQSVNSIMTTYG